LKILLLNPPVLDHSKNGKNLAMDSFPMLGLYYLQSYLKNNGYKCKIYDFYFEEWENIENILKRENADVIGITCLTESRYNSLKLLSMVRKVRRNTIVIFGGHHSTYMYDQLLSKYNIDYIVLGEGEQKLLNLIKALDGIIPIESVKGIAYKKNGKVIKNGSVIDNCINNLDSLNFPISTEHLKFFEKYPPLNVSRPVEFKKFSHLPFVYERGKSTLIVTSRGCPFKCQFCGARSFWGKKYRFRSPENVVDEIEYYNKEYGFNFFRLWDYTFTLIPQHGIEICKEILKRNLNIFFACQTRADRITEELTIWLKRAGCLFIGIGVESGSEKILEEINKNVSIKSVIKAFSIFKKYNLLAYPLLMVGNPSETAETVQETINLLKKIRPYKVITQKTMIFPGTALYELAKEQKFVDDEYWLSSKPQPYYTFENPLKKLLKWEFEIQNYNKKKFQKNILKIVHVLVKFKDIFAKKFLYNPNSNIKLIRLYDKLRNIILKIMHFIRL
jgi:radical SAM superfamily enzyme YgiQ (UPF0313 family)